jgi:hypothetical protein
MVRELHGRTHFETRLLQLDGKWIRVQLRCHDLKCLIPLIGDLFFEEALSRKLCYYHRRMDMSRVILRLKDQQPPYSTVGRESLKYPLFKNPFSSEHPKKCFCAPRSIYPTLFIRLKIWICPLCIIDMPEDNRCRRRWHTLIGFITIRVSQKCWHFRKSRQQQLFIFDDLLWAAAKVPFASICAKVAQ